MTLLTQLMAAERQQDLLRAAGHHPDRRTGRRRLGWRRPAPGAAGTAAALPAGRAGTAPAHDPAAY
ncbi:MAG TPA: hypothetical protein VFR49_14615 [Solirubrobacteraceae bacterium]|nr:hypothetical protein [Solirubrobacteraceae bacterium]